MSKNSTILFTINNLASKSSEEITDSNSIFEFKEEFEDVYKVLNTLDIDICNEVANSVLKYANGTR